MRWDSSGKQCAGKKPKYFTDLARCMWALGHNCSPASSCALIFRYNVAYGRLRFTGYVFVEQLEVLIVSR